MPKIQPELNIRQLQKAIDRLSASDQVELTRTILKKTWLARFESLLKRIQRRTGKASAVSPAALRKVCEEARQELYETRYRYQHSR